MSTTMSPSVGLLDAFPDLILDLSRGGSILGHAGGTAVPALHPSFGAVGRPLAAVYPEPIAALLKQLVRRAIAGRDSSESAFVHLDIRYEARVKARSSDRALCIIRALSAPSIRPADAVFERDQQPLVDRREFWHRVRESIATASLSGRPLALAIIHLEGPSDIAKLLDATVAANVVAQVLRSLVDKVSEHDSTDRCIGQLADDELAVLVNSGLRDTIERCALQVCAQLSEPVSLGDAIFKLKPCAGVAILGQDATNERSLLEHARAAMVEARRAELGGVSFFSDTMKLRSLTRIDVALELREAIEGGEIGLQYRGRHDFASGRLTALVGYLKWNHPMRGVVHPAHFLPAAAATGLATVLSRSILEQLQRDFAIHKSYLNSGVRLSYGALRHHVLDANFFDDVDELLDSEALPAESLELRISERSYVAKDSRNWRRLTDRGVQIIVDEVGRKMSSIDRLARAPISGLQLDRTCAAAMDSDEAAKRVGLAVLAVARALGLTPITTAVDNDDQRAALLALGWMQGSGDLWT